MKKTEIKTEFIQTFKIKKSVKEALLKMANKDRRSLVEFLRIELEKITEKC